MPRKPKQPVRTYTGLVQDRCGEPRRDIVIERDDLKYTDEEWQQPSCDTRGHSERIGCRVPPQMAAELSLALEHFRTRTGYRTVNDVVRHALARHIEYLHRIEPTMKNTYLGAIQAMQLILSQDRHRSETESVFRELEARVESHIEKGDRGEVVRLVSEVKHRLDHTPSTPWKMRWLERYRVRYAHYLLVDPAVPVVEDGDSSKGVN